MNDATIQFALKLDPASRAEFLAVIKGYGDQAEQAGKRFGDGAKKGAKDGFQEFMQNYGKFLAMGAAVQRVWSGIGDTMRGAADLATKRVSEWESKNAAMRGGALSGQARVSALQMTGLDRGVAGAFSTRLKTLEDSGHTGISSGFLNLAKSFARAGLSGDALKDRLETGLGALSQRGHLDGFGDAYGLVATAKGVSKGADLKGLATGLLMRGGQISSEQEGALRSGLSDGSIGVDRGGKLTVQGVADAAALAAVAAVNKLGGLGLRQGQAEKTWSASARNTVTGEVYFNNTGRHAARAGEGDGLEWEDPGMIGGGRPDGTPGVGDYASVAAQTPFLQMDAAAGLMKGAQKLPWARMRAALSGGAMAVGGGEAAVGAGAGVAAATGSRLLPRLLAGSGVVSAAAIPLMIGGDSQQRMLSSENIDQSARDAINNPQLRNSLMNGQADGDPRDIAVLERMHEVLLQILEEQRQSRGLVQKD